MPTVVITGAAGFIGTAMLSTFRAQGWNVVPVVRSAEQRTDPAAHVLQLDQDDLGPLLQEHAPDLCVHCAGTSSVPASVEHPAVDYRDNVGATQRVLEAIRTHAPQCKFLLLSSAAVYGNPQSLPVREDAPLFPISPYGEHKLQCEQLCKDYADRHGVLTAVARIFSGYGTGLRSRVFWDICTKAMASDSIALFGTGKETRDFLHIADVVAALQCIALHAQWNGDVYNLGSGEETTIEHLVSLLLPALGAPHVAVHWSGALPVGVPSRWCADISKLRSFGFAPAVALGNGVVEYAAWYKNQRMQ
jgi:UDP-glucose 4-epimerase